MQWVVVGEPEVHRQLGKWVVRRSGYDAATGRRRMKQFGTFATKREALAHRKAAVAGLVLLLELRLAPWWDALVL